MFDLELKKLDNVDKNELSMIEVAHAILADEGKTPLFFTEDGILLGVIAVADTIKPTSRSAIEDLKRMGITDTQILIVRHFDKEHPHVHIAFNRIANDGRTISDRNERIRSTRICKELTRKYGLYFADGKEQVKRHRLKEPDKTKYELYSILKSEVVRCGNWSILIANLKKQGVDVRFKYKGSSDEVQGVVFSKNGYPFSGSKIDRRFSYSKIDAALNANRHKERQRVIGGQTADPEYPMQQPPQYEPSGNDELYSGSIGLFMPANVNAQADENYFEEQLKRKNKKKKQHKIRF